MTIFGGGEDSCRNLLNIIPRLGSDQGGSTIVVIKAESVHVDTLTEYLDAISPLKILRAREGMTLDSGYCYVASTQDQICLQQFSTQQTLGKVKQLVEGMGAIDMAMASVAAAFKRKCAGVLRITSYNVCYTKLLRPMPQGAKVSSTINSRPVL